MATPLTPQQELEEQAPGASLTELEIRQPYRKLYGTPRSRIEKRSGIRRMYQRLVRFFQVKEDKLHMQAYPPALEDLSDRLVVLAFERAEALEPRFCPLPGRLRELVAADIAAEVEELWQGTWRSLLDDIARHGWQWKPVEIAGKKLEHGRLGPMETIEPPELGTAIERAIRTFGGGGWQDGLRSIYETHPRFFGESWSSPESPRLAAERIEKKIRDLWESYR
jgi:hypothetical protein